MAKHFFSGKFRFLTIIGISCALLSGLFMSGLINTSGLDTAFAGINCPTGSTLVSGSCYTCPTGETQNGTTCTLANAKTCPAGYTGPLAGICSQQVTTYTCASGSVNGVNCVAANKVAGCISGYTLSGLNCYDVASKVNSIMHISQCYIPSTDDALTRIVVDNNSAPLNVCDAPNRVQVESTTLNLVTSRYLTSQFCESLTDRTTLTRFLVGNTDPGNPCAGDTGRRLNPSSGEQYGLHDLYQATRYLHISYCADSSGNKISRILVDNSSTPVNICTSDSIHNIQIESPQTFDIGYPNQPSTFVCPSGWTDLGGANCSRSAISTNTTNTQAGVCPSGYTSSNTTSNDCQHAATVVTSGVTFTPEVSNLSFSVCPSVTIGQPATCSFFITNTTGFPLAVPIVSAQIQGVSGVSTTASISGNNLLISNIPTTNGVVNMTLPVAVTINGSVFSPTPFTALNPLLATPSVLDAAMSCTPLIQSVGGLINCSGTLPANTIATNPVVKVGSTGTPTSCIQSGVISAGYTITCSGINVGQLSGLKDVLLSNTGTVALTNTKIDAVRVTSVSDLDGDGIPNVIDADVDGDCGLDISYDKSKPNCLNGNDLDGNGIIDGFTGVDGSGNPIGTATGCSGLSVAGCMIDGTGKPFDSTKIDQDIDGDGVLNTTDTDIDGDGVLNQNDTDSDNDGFIDPADQDSDNDGIPNTTDTTPRGPGSANITTIDIATNISNSGNCTGQDVIIGALVSCDFPLTGSTVNSYQLPTGGITGMIATATGSVSCSIVDNTLSTARLTCANLPTISGTVGSQAVKLNTIQKGTVSLKVQVNPATQAELIDSITCSPNPTTISTKVTCIGQLPANTTANNLKISLNGTTVDCTVSTTGGIACPEISVGSTAGTFEVKASTSTITSPFVVDSILVTKPPLTETDLQSLIIVCGINNTFIYVNDITDCRFTLPSDKSLPSGFKLSISDGNPVLCTTSGQTVNCDDIPSGTKTGTQKVFGYIGGTKVDTKNTVSVIDPNATITTTPASPKTTTPTTTPRTGGSALSLGAFFLVVSIVALGSGFVLNKRAKQKINL